MKSLPSANPVRWALAAGVLVSVSLVGCGGGGADETQRIQVLAAASLTEVFGDLASRFERSHPPAEVNVSFGSSAQLAQQLAAGLPADVFASADDAIMRAAVDRGDVVAPRAFARSRLVIAVARGNPLGIARIQDLDRPGVVLVACAAEAPCGKLAVRALADAGVKTRPAAFEENVKAVLSKVVLGEADAGFVYETDVRAADDAVQAVAIGGVTAYEASYSIAAATASEQPQLANRFITFVTAGAAKSVLTDAGFSS